jgi:hypothetical protein
MDTPETRKLASYLQQHKTWLTQVNAFALPVVAQYRKAKNIAALSVRMQGRRWNSPAIVAIEAACKKWPRMLPAKVSGLNISCIE